MFRRCAISCVIIVLALHVLARTRPRYGGTLHIETTGDPLQRPGGIARQLVFDGLTAFGAHGEVVPALAIQWSAEDNDHRWQFRLRPGVHFQDGTLLTAVNVVASLNSACPANCPWTTVRAVGSSVVFLDDAPTPNLPALLATDEFRIALTLTTNGMPTTPNIGTGPFQVTASGNGVVSLTANESCWQGRPFVDSIEIRGHRAVRDQWLDLTVGRADVVEVPAEMLRQAQQQRLNVVLSPFINVLALQISDFGPLSNPMLRASIAAAVDRVTLFNVIYQKQGEITASLLPQSLTGYSFLFPVARDLSRAHELRGGLSSPSLSLKVVGDSAMQLAAQRIALDLHDAGFNVQTAHGDPPHADLQLNSLPLVGSQPEAALDVLLRGAGFVAPPIENDPQALYKAERTILDQHTLVPLLDLPRGYATSARVRDFHLRADGTPDLADTSLEARQ